MRAVYLTQLSQGTSIPPKAAVQDGSMGEGSVGLGAAVTVAVARDGSVGEPRKRNQLPKVDKANWVKRRSVYRTQPSDGTHSEPRSRTGRSARVRWFWEPR